MANTVPSFSEFLSESSLSRLWRQNVAHDCGAITAWRNTDSHGVRYTRAQKQARNRALLSTLMINRYAVTSVFGTFPETDPKTGEYPRDAAGKIIPTKEESFFVVDQHDTGRLSVVLVDLGVQYDQDSILFIPRGAVEGHSKDKAILIGTNHTGELGMGNHLPFNRGRFGYDSPYYTTVVNGRPFIFEETGSEHLYPQTGFGVWYLHTTANEDWRQL